MDSPNLKTITEEVMATSSQEMLCTLVNLKLQEIDNLMEIPKGMYPYPFAGMTRQLPPPEVLYSKMCVSE